MFACERLVSNAAAAALAAATPDSALTSDLERRRRDSNPRIRRAHHQFSRLAPSTGLGHTSVGSAV